MNIFQHNGAIDTSIDPATIPPIRRDEFIALRDAQLACEEAEASEKSANEAVVELMKAHDRAHAAIPRESFLDLWRASRGRHSVVNGTSQPGDMSVRNGQSAKASAVDPIAALQQAEHQLDLARVHARECRSAVAEARTAFSKALAGWNTTQPIQTQEQLMKQHIASNQAERAKRYAAGQGVHYMGVGRTAKALAGGNAKNGGGAAFRRGAFTRAQAMEINAAKLRANTVAAKLPSRR